MDIQTQEKKPRSVYLESQVLEQLETRRDRTDLVNAAERGWLINRMLDRYLHLLSDRRNHLRPSFSNEELGLMVDACNGAIWYAHSIQHLPLEIADAIELDRLDEKWGVDGAGLVAKLKALDLLSLCALVDGIERFWSGAYHKVTSDYSIVLT